MLARVLRMADVQAGRVLFQVNHWRGDPIKKEAALTTRCPHCFIATIFVVCLFQKWQRLLGYGWLRLLDRREAAVRGRLKEGSRRGELNSK